MCNQRGVAPECGADWGQGNHRALPALTGISDWFSMARCCQALVARRSLRGGLGSVRGRNLFSLVLRSLGMWKKLVAPW